VGVSTVIASDAMISALMAEVDTLLKLYMEQCYRGLSQYLLNPATLLATIYLAIQGIRIMFGQLDLDLWVAIKTCLRIGAIFTLLGSGGWGYVSEYLYDFLSAASEKLGNLLIKSESPLDLGSVFDGLQGVLNQFSAIGEDFFSTGHWMSPLPYIDGLVVWGVGFAITGFGLFQIIVAKVLFSMLIVFLPVLLVFCFFEIFQGLLDRWLGFVIGVFFLQILISVVLAFDLSLSDWWLGSFQISAVTHLSNLSAIPVLILGIISIGLMGKVSTLAYAIGSGVSSLSGSSGGGGFIRRGLWGGHHLSNDDPENHRSGAKSRESSQKYDQESRKFKNASRFSWSSDDSGHSESYSRPNSTPNHKDNSKTGSKSHSSYKAIQQGADPEIGPTHHEE
jgi:type IV secretion system protein VirB6